MWWWQAPSCSHADSVSPVDWCYEPPQRANATEDEPDLDQLAERLDAHPGLLRAVAYR